MARTGTSKPSGGPIARTSGRAKAHGEAWADRIERRLPGALGRVVREARGDDVLLLAAGLAFYAVVSIAPLVILIMAVTSAVVGDQRLQQVATAASRIAPEQLGVDRALGAVAQHASGLTVIAFLTGLWPATAYGSGLVRAFDRLSEGSKGPAKGTIGRALALLFLLPLFVLGGILGSYLGAQALGTSALGRGLGLLLALLTGFLGTAASVALIYRIFPPERLGRRRILLATAFTAGAISLMSLAFSAYLGLGANFQEHYASSGLAAFVLLAVWLFLANTMLLVGYKMAQHWNGRR